MIPRGAFGGGFHVFQFVAGNCGEDVAGACLARGFGSGNFSAGVDQAAVADGRQQTGEGEVESEDADAEVAFVEGDGVAGAKKYVVEGGAADGAGRGGEDLRCSRCGEGRGRRFRKPWGILYGERAWGSNAEMPRPGASESDGNVWRYWFGDRFAGETGQRVRPLQLQEGPPEGVRYVGEEQFRSAYSQGVCFSSTIGAHEKRSCGAWMSDLGDSGGRCGCC